jgi:hypothetical protein
VESAVGFLCFLWASGMGARSDVSARGAGTTGLLLCVELGDPRFRGDDNKEARG